jgi:hypothetical protein
MASETTSASTIGSGDSCITPAWMRDSSNRSSTIRTIESTSERICR